MNQLDRLALLTRGFLYAATLLFAAGSTAAAAVPNDPAPTRPRLLVLTDIGGDPDDQQAMIRLMTYANEFEIEGLIATASGVPGELKRKIVQPRLIGEIVEAYGRVRDNLAKHAPGYPTARQLLDRIKSGNPHRGREAIGRGHDTEGSGWIMRVVDQPDPRLVNIVVWGGQTDLAQALWRVRHDRDEAGLRRFLGKVRVYDIGNQDGIEDWIFENFPDLFYVLANAPQGADRRLGVYRGMYLGGDESLTSREWIDTHVRRDHGPLGALYPTKTWTAPNPHGALKEGDTPSWFYFLPFGLGNPAHPEWGGWGGRFRHAQRGLYRDAADTVAETTDARATVWRWRPAYQHDFQARMDWCVRPPDGANHAPRAVLQADRSRRVLQLRAAPGAAVRLSAGGSSDRDGDTLAYRWWVYGEAGTCPRPVRVENARRPEAIVHVPSVAPGTTIHVVLEVTDDGSPPLVGYRRVVLQVE